MPAQRRTVLLLEDEPLLSWDLEDMMRDAGVGEPIVLSSCSAASAWLDANSPDVAVLDIMLSDGEATTVAQTLLERGVPFVVHSAHSRWDSLTDPVFLQGVWVSKLCDPDLLIGAVTDCLASRN